MHRFVRIEFGQQPPLLFRRQIADRFLALFDLVVLLEFLNVADESLRLTFSVILSIVLEYPSNSPINSVTAVFSGNGLYLY